MKTFATILIALTACTGEDANVGPDAAGTKPITFTACDSFANKLTRSLLRSCVFDLTGVDWLERDGLPALFVAQPPGGSVPFEYGLVGENTYRADAHVWADADGEYGEAVLLKEGGRCAWVQCKQ